MRPALVGLARLALASIALALPTLSHARAADAPLASAGALPHLEVRGDAALELPLRHTDVKAEVSGIVARVEVTQTFANASSTPIEAVYVFPLPEHSAVEGFTLVAGDRRIEAEVKRRAEARRTYEAARAQGHTAALLEQERANIFTQSVANLPPGEPITVTIRFSELLAYDAGEYEFVFPLVVGPRYVSGAPSGTRSGTGTRADTDAVPDASRISPPVLPEGTRGGHDVSIAVDVDTGRPTEGIEVPSHEVSTQKLGDGRFRVQLSDRDNIPNRDFILRYRVRGDTSAAVIAHRAGADGHFALVLQPPELDVDQLVGHREMLFVVDVSGSMFGLPLWLCQQAMRDALGRLRPDDTFNILTFSGATAFAFQSPRRASPENIADGLSFVNRMTAGGGTEMLDAISAALEPKVEPGRRRYVFFLTDGWVGNDAQIIGATHRFEQQMTEQRQVARVFSFGVGSAPNRALLDGIAREGRGVAVYASNREDPRRGVMEIYRRVDKPIIEDVSIDWNGLPVSEVGPQVPGDLFASRPLVLTGRYNGPATRTIHVRGTTEDGRRVDLRFEVTLPEREERNTAMETLWARGQIEEHSNALAFDRFDGRKTGTREHAITDLGLRYHLATEFTSFVAVDRSRVVGDGKPRTVVQPVEVPEDTDATMAGAETAALGGKMGNAGGLGGLGVKGTGAGGGGYGMGVGSFTVIGRGSGAVGYGHGVGGLGGKTAGDVSLANEEAVVSGSLDKSLIQAVIKRNRQQIRSCYELTRNPQLIGKVAIAFVIGPDGKVQSASVAQSTAGNAALEQCVVARVKTWVFPKPTGGGTVQITYPFVFKPSN